MPDEQDRAEALDDDKGSFPPASRGVVVDVIDQTADADPTDHPDGTAAIDDDEAGDDLVGIDAEPDIGDDPFHTEEPAPEVAALHIDPEGEQP